MMWTNSFELLFFLQVYNCGFYIDFGFYLVKDLKCTVIEGLL